MVKLTPSQERELRDAFNLFDSDHSGRISKEELRKVLHAMNIKVNDKELQQLMSQMDADNSGEIDYHEFKNVMAEAFFKRYSRQELLEAFNRLDTDGNGYITCKELNDILSGMGRHLSENDIKAMISSVDSDGDGTISFDEFYKLIN